MKKFLSKVLTLALVCAIVVTGTSITSEAKGKKSSKKAKTTVTAYSNNAVVNDFVTTLVNANGLTIGGTSYNAKQVYDLLLQPGSIVQQLPYFSISSIVDEGYTSRTDISHIDNGQDYDSKYLVIHNPVIYYYFSTAINPKLVMYDGPASGDQSGLLYSDNNGYATDVLAANGVNASRLSLWMQTRNLKTYADIYNYLVANGATFVPAADGNGNLICQQCSGLSYCVYAEGEGIIEYTGGGIQTANMYFPNNYTIVTTYHEGGAVYTEYDCCVYK